MWDLFAHKLPSHLGCVPSSRRYRESRLPWQYSHRPLFSINNNIYKTRTEKYKRSCYGITIAIVWMYLRFPQADLEQVASHTPANLHIFSVLIDHYTVVEFTIRWPYIRTVAHKRIADVWPANFHQPQKINIACYEVLLDSRRKMYWLK